MLTPFSFVVSVCDGRVGRGRWCHRRNGSNTSRRYGWRQRCWRTRRRARSARSGVLLVDDDDLTFADGSYVRLRSDYPYCVEVRDLDRDIERQRATGRRVFAALKARGSRKLVHIDNVQHVLDSYDPRHLAAQ